MKVLGAGLSGIKAGAVSVIDKVGEALRTDDAVVAVTADGIGLQLGELLSAGEIKPLAGSTALEEIETVVKAVIAPELVHNGVEAVLKNGYYEVNGFKFSKYYYERLWEHGRPAPSLVATEILTNAKSIVPDGKMNGFFKYMTESWEMVYNPVTKEVWHIQPIKG